ERVPVDARVVDDRRRDRLGDDALHHLDDRALLVAPFGVGVVGLELVAQVPVADEAQPLGEQALALVPDEVVHPDVVLGDVEVGGGGGARDLLLHLGGDAAGGPPRPARPRPPAPRVARPPGGGLPWRGAGGVWAGAQTQ